MSITYVENYVSIVHGVSAVVTSGSIDVSDSGGKRVITVAATTEDNNAGTLSIANSGTALTWNDIGESAATASNCRVRAWWAFGDNNGNRTISVTQSGGNFGCSLHTVAHVGAHQTTPVPAGNVFSGVGTVDVNQAVTPTASGSAIWLSAGDWNQTNSFATTPTIGSTSCTRAQNNDEAGAFTACVMRPTTQPRTDASALSIGEDSTASKVSWLAFEVQAAEGGGASNILDDSGGFPGFEAQSNPLVISVW